MTARERLQLLVGGFGEEQAERALELLSPLIGAAARPGQRVRQLPAFVGIGGSSWSDISEHVDDPLAGASARSPASVILVGTNVPCALADPSGKHHARCADWLQRSRGSHGHRGGSCRDVA